MTPPSLDIAGFGEFERIGSGGFSSVYKARQASMGRDVAIKVLNTDVSSERDRRTFERECHALGLLSRHPHIVTVYSEAFASDGRPCIVMELYRANYRERLETDGPLPISELLTLGVKVAGALEVAHASGILHRDLKPHNIFVSDYGEPALGDFGISTADDERSVSAASGLSVAYAAPEVLEEANATAAADIYSLAATLYHLAEGTAPFAAPQLRATVKKILTEPPAPPTRVDIPESLVAVLSHAMNKAPDDRYPSMSDFAEALRGVQHRLGDERTMSPRRHAAEPPGPPAGTSDGEGRTIARDKPSLTGVRPVSPVGETPAQHRQPLRPVDTGGAGLASSATVDAPPGEHTVRRARPDTTQGHDLDVELDEPAASSSRRWAAGALGAGAIVVLIGALVLGGGDGQEDPAPTTAIVAAPAVSDGLGGNAFEQVSAPQRVVARVGAAGTVEVSFDAVEDATKYRLIAVGNPSLGDDVDNDATEGRIVVETDVDPSRAECWAVQAIGASGNLSNESAPACVQG